MNPTYQIVYWRDIPAQIRLRFGGKRLNRQLTPRFQEAIDAAAMQANTTSSDDYLAEWRSSDWQTFEGDPESKADALVAQVEGEYTPERLRALVLSKGYEVSTD